MPYTLEQFAAGIKAQYPQYKDWPDDYLAKEMLSKFPQYKAWIGGAAPGPPKPPAMAEVPESGAGKAVATMFPKVSTQDFQKRFGRDVSADIGGIPKGISSMIQNAQKRYQAKEAGEPNVALDFLRAHGIPTGPLAAAEANVEAIVGPTAEGVASVSAPGLVQRMRAGEDPAKMAADMTTAVMGPEMAEEGAFWGQRTVRPGTAPETAARSLTDIINPANTERASFRENLTKHIDKVTAYVDRRNAQAAATGVPGLNLGSPEHVVQSIEESGDALKQHFDARILNPVRDRSVPGGNSIPGYTGRREGGIVTIGDLNDRLVAINNEIGTLRAGKTDVAGQMAVKKSIPELEAEGVAIRRIYYQELSKATGIPAPQLEQLREAFGEMRKLADQGRQALETRGQRLAERRAAPRTSWRGPGKEETAQAQAARRLESRTQKTIEGLRRYGRSQYQPPYPGQPTATVRGRVPPIRDVGAPWQGTTVGVTETTPAEREAHVQRLAERGRQVGAEKAAKAARVGGARLARGPAGAPEGPTFGETVDISPAEREAHLQKLAERGRQVREAREARARKIAAARAARRRPPEE